MAPGHRLITSTELARELHVSRRTIGRWHAAGWITPAETTLGGHHRWDIDAVRAQIERLRREWDDRER